MLDGLTMNIDIALLAIAALPMIFAITLHEAAHGYVARYFGDPTAYQMGRISLNPIPMLTYKSKTLMENCFSIPPKV